MLKQSYFSFVISFTNFASNRLIEQLLETGRHSNEAEPHPKIVSPPAFTKPGRRGRRSLADRALLPRQPEYPPRLILRERHRGLDGRPGDRHHRSEEHTSELQSLR